MVATLAAAIVVIMPTIVVLVMNPWQQGMMYPMGMMPGMPTANGSPAPPPPPPEQNWVSIV